MEFRGVDLKKLDLIGGAYLTESPFGLLTREEYNAVANFKNRLGTIYTNDIEEMFFFGFRTKANCLKGWKGVKTASIVGTDDTVLDRNGLRVDGSAYINSNWTPATDTVGGVATAYAYFAWVGGVSSNEASMALLDTPSSDFSKRALIRSSGPTETTTFVQYAVNSLDFPSGLGIVSDRTFAANHQYATITYSGSRVSISVNGNNNHNSGVITIGGFPTTPVEYRSGNGGYHLGGGFMKNATHAKLKTLYDAFALLMDEMGIRT